MIERSIKPDKGLRKAAAWWFGLLGVIAATAAVVLVPISVDPDMLSRNPAKAYHPPQLRVLLMIAEALLVTVLAVLILGGRRVGVPVLVPALVLLGVSAASAFFSERPIHSLSGDRSTGLLSLGAGVLLFYALAHGLVSVSRVRFFLVAATVTAVFVSIFGIAQNYGLDPFSDWGVPPFTSLSRPSATIGNPLTLTAYLTLMMGTATALWLGAGSRARRTVWLLALALIGACWIYTETRGALAGAAVALPVVLFAVRRKMGTARPLLVPTAVLVSAMIVAVAASRAFGFSSISLRICAVLLAYLAVVGAFAWLLELGKARLSLVLFLVVLVGLGGAVAFALGKLSLSDLLVVRESTNPRSPGGDISTQTRLYIWRDIVPMILDRPLLGHGPDNFAKPFKLYMSEELKALITNGQGQVAILDRAHSQLFQVAATTGLLGLAAYLWVLVSYFRNAYRYGGWALAALSGGMLAYVLQIQTSFPSVATEVVFWGILGVSVALMRLSDTEGAEGPPGDSGTRPPSEPSGKLPGELPVVVAVVVLIAAITVPTLLQQREKAIANERRSLAADVRETVDLYERTYNYAEVYPETGVYDREHPVKNRNGGKAIKPSRGVTITTRTTPEGNFMVEGKSLVLAGTFWYSYDSTSEEYSTAPNPNT